MGHTELKPLPPSPTPPPQSSALSPQPSPTPSNDDLLTALFALNGDIDQLIRDFNLTPKRFLAFTKDPEVIEVLAAWEALQERHHRTLARQRQAIAAEHLTHALELSMTPIEARRAATALARLATSMLTHRTTRPAKPAPATQPAAAPPTQSSALSPQHSSSTQSSALSPQHSPTTQSSALSPQHSPPPSTARPAA